MPEGEKRRVRNLLVTEHMALANRIARRFDHRGQTVEDLVQVARIGLIHAVDRFDPDRGTDFLSFAVPTITGEIRRYFRDLSWLVSVPRKLQERHRAIRSVANEMLQELAAVPRPRQIADRLGVSVDEVYEGLRAGHAYHTSSLSGLGTDQDGEQSHEAWLGENDARLELVENRETLYGAIAQLPDRDSAIVVMRFFGNMTQSQIAREFGLSQAQVSRILNASVARLRRAFFDASLTSAADSV